MLLVANLAVGCQYFLPGPRLPSQLHSVIALGQLLGEQNVNDLPMVAASWQNDQQMRWDIS